MRKLQYKEKKLRNKQDVKKITTYTQEIKLVWSSQSELVNDFDRFDWRRLRIVLRGSMPMMSAAHLPLTTEGMSLAV